MAKANAEWFKSCINTNVLHKGKLSLVAVAKKWIAEHPDFNGTHEEQAKAAAKFSGEAVNKTHIALARSNKGGKASKAAPFEKLVEVAIDKLDCSVDELIAKVEKAKPDYLTLFIKAAGGQQQALEQLRSIKPKQPDVTVTLDW